jgi:hypothetical protein
MEPLPDVPPATEDAMIEKESELFFQFPSETSRRILHPVVVTDASGETFTARFEEPGLVPKPGQNVLIYFEDGREFKQQSVRITSVHESDSLAVFTFETTGHPVSAEGRENFRARTIALDLFCEFDAEKRCAVHDVSATGLCVVASSMHRVGDNISIAFEYDGILAEGTVCVQSVRELHSGRFRYGLHSIGKDEQAAAFRDALSRIGLGVQRAQLERLSQAG